MLFNSQIRQYHKELHRMYDQKRKLSQRYGYAIEMDDNPIEATNVSKELEKLSSNISSLIENEYAQAVFEEYKAKKPVLIEVNTGEEISWDHAFGNDFSKISKSIRYSLVGLVEEPGRYIFKK